MKGLYRITTTNKDRSVKTIYNIVALTGDRAIIRLHDKFELHPDEFVDEVVRISDVDA